tara:strand:- start:3964 stop:4173 length:210 start_codon:yes stop_codon:yes gene_type:complete
MINISNAMSSDMYAPEMWSTLIVSRFAEVMDFKAIGFMDSAMFGKTMNRMAFYVNHGQTVERALRESYG